MSDRAIRVHGAAQNNLADLDVVIGPGLTAIVGVSGSGKSSLAFDTVYHEAHRRFIETLALGSSAARSRPAAVKSIIGLGPAVSIAQNVLNRNPNSTVATALGAHPFLRILFARFSHVACPNCATSVRTLTSDERVRIAGELGGRVQVALVRAVRGRHTRLLALLDAQVGRGAIEVDGRPWDGRPLRAARVHDIFVTTSELRPGAPPARVRAELDQADAWGSHEVIVNGRSLLRSPICPGCGAWVPRLQSTAFRPEATVDTSSHRIAGRTIGDVLGLTAEGFATFISDAAVGPTGRRLSDELTRRIAPLVSLGLDHITLDRPMPTLSRGESQRVRLAIVVAGRLEDLLHVLDEPSVGLHRRDMQNLFKVLASLPGPVLMVEHDAAAIASADDVIELGPAAGSGGGHLVFQGTPAAMWDSDTVSGRFFSGRVRPAERTRRAPGDEFIVVRGASTRNLGHIDCRFPVGRVSAVTGPSGAGKTTLVRDVVLASAARGQAVGCGGFESRKLRALAVDQSPLGNNPRSNPATYTKAFDGIRARFAAETGGPLSMFTFNRPEGACPTCEGMGAVELTLRFLASTWVDCDSCDGRRYKPEVLELRATIGGAELTIADALALSVDDARELFADDRTVRRILDALHEVGLGYLALGQPSPTLSGGEAQRVRLARELARARAGDLVVLDEPTTGLHPADLARLLAVLDGLADAGCTVIVVEHHPDVVAAADWIVELGPGGGPHGGRLLHCGPPGRSRLEEPKPRRVPRRRPRATDSIRVRGAAANNLRNLSVEIPKGKFTAVTGVSGSGKSSLVRDVIEAEAMRRLLESLSMYERQGAREGPEAPVRSVEGLGPTLVLGAERRWASGYSEGLNRPSATVGWATDITRLLSIVVARGGQRQCLSCGGEVRRLTAAPESRWRCVACGTEALPLESRHLNAQTPIAACPRCAGLGTIRRGDVSRLIVKPDAPICGGAMLSPGYYPRGYYCTPGTGGYAMLQALAARYAFDPKSTPWREMTTEAREAFLHGDKEPLPVPGTWEARDARWVGVMTMLTSWDQGGLYTTGATCPECRGKRLRHEYLSITLDGKDRTDLHEMPLVDLEEVLAGAQVTDEIAEESRVTALRRVDFLRRVGLGYVHLDRLTFTLSAGEAQRLKLAAVLGGELLGMTVLLDEPSRGLHPREVAAVAGALEQLRDAGNTVVAVEHDGVLLSRADHIIEVGPGPGERGGRLMYHGARRGVKKGSATADAIAGVPAKPKPRRSPTDWMEIRGATGNNLAIDRLRLPLGVLAGVCGVSGSGKSTLMVDTIGLALAPPKMTTSVAMSQFEPSPHESIAGAPVRTVVVDQSKAHLTSPGDYLGVLAALRRAYAASDDAVGAGLTEADFTVGCDACRSGHVVESMGFLPVVAHTCETCDGTGYRAEARVVVARGRTLAEAEGRTIDQLVSEWSDVATIERACSAAGRLGLGYLVVRQPSWTLSGGEAQRLKLSRELAKKASRPTLYLLDEPTVGLHVRDVETLVSALNEVVDAGHSVIAVEHDPNLLVRCDWLVELGPGAGPDGGRVIAEGPPEHLATLGTPTGPYLRAALA